MPTIVPCFLPSNATPFQGHAELTSDLVMEKIHPALTASGRLTPGLPARPDTCVWGWGGWSGALACSLAQPLAGAATLCAVMLPFAAAEEAEASATSIQHTSTDAPLLTQFFQQFMLLGLGPAAPDEHADEPSSSTAAAAGLVPGALPDPAAEEAVREAARDLERCARRAVAAELARGPQEQELLRQLNTMAAQRVQQMLPAVTAARRQLDAASERHAVLLPALRAVDNLEMQVAQLEQCMAEMEATAARLEAVKASS